MVVRRRDTLVTTLCQAAPINIDPSGKVRLSRKVLLKEDEGTKPRYSAEEKAAHKAAAPPERESFGGRGGDRGGRGGGGGRGGDRRGPRR